MSAYFFCYVFQQAEMRLSSQNCTFLWFWGWICCPILRHSQKQLYDTILACCFQAACWPPIMARTGRELWPCWPGKTAICTFLLSEFILKMHHPSKVVHCIKTLFLSHTWNTDWYNVSIRCFVFLCPESLAVQHLQFSYHCSMFYGLKKERVWIPSTGGKETQLEVTNRLVIGVSFGS